MSRTALVTGGCSGIGTAVVRRLRADGVRVLTLDIDDRADVVVDVSDTTAVAPARLGRRRRWRRHPGQQRWHRGRQPSSAPDHRRRLAAGACRQRARNGQPLPGPRAGHGRAGLGRIVNLASMAGKDGNAGLSAYSASKAAVIALTKSLGKELAGTGGAGRLGGTGGHRHSHEREHRTGGSRTADVADPAWPPRPAGGSGGAGVFHRVRPVQLLDRRGLRCQRRARHLLTAGDQGRLPADRRCPHGVTMTLVCPIYPLCSYI